MAKMDVNELRQFADKVFKDHWPVMTLWQTLADHFYPERADFTQTRNVGQELADSLVDSYPLLVRRDLGNSLSSMLRDGEWFSMTTAGMDVDHSAKLWLDQSTHRLRKHMYQRSANFVRATKEGDHDYATFGQCVISIEMNRLRDGLLYRCWHMRDCAWFDDVNGQVGGLIRKWKPTQRQLVDFFGDKTAQRIRDNLADQPFKEINVRHLMIPSRMYRDDQIQERFEWVSIYLDLDNNHIMEEVGMHHNQYVVPRFQTISGSPYAYSPSTVVGLPDARCLQAMTHTLLEAGERYARPPLIATQKVVRGDVNLRPDGITWVDDEYDERLGAALRPIAQDRGGFPIGLEMRAGIVDVMNSAFYLNKLNLPEVTREMTAYEVSERMKQYRRENLPLFAPIEAEYNGALCEVSFQVAMQAGLLGSPYDIPESLKGADAEFKFESPLSAFEEEQKATRFGQVSQLLAQAAEYDPGVTAVVDFDTAIRDAITGVGAPASWLTDPAQAAIGRAGKKVEQLVSDGVVSPEDLKENAA